MVTNPKSESRRDTLPGPGDDLKDRQAATAANVVVVSDRPGSNTKTIRADPYVHAAHLSADVAIVAKPWQRLWITILQGCVARGWGN